MADRDHSPAPPPPADPDPARDDATDPGDDPAGARPRRLLLAHVAFLAVTALAWLIDAPVFAAVDRWYNGPQPVKGELHQLILSLAMFGQGLGIVLTLALVAVFDGKRRERAAVLGVVLVAVGFACSAAKTLIGRERPLTSRGNTVLHGPKAGWRNSRQQSFPSGHTTTAVAITICLTRFYPQSAGLMWLLAGAVGVNRVVTCAHYPSDVVAGAWLGFLLATTLLRSRRLWGAAHALAPAVGRLVAFGRLSQHRAAATAGAWGRRAAGSPLLLVGVCLTVYLAGNGSTPLWDRDEPRFATATREMLARGDLIVPTFNGELRPDKPILIYWLMAGSYKLFGDGPFAARFASAVAGAAAVTTTYVLGRALFGPRVALAAGWVLGLAPMTVVESKLATADALLLAFVTLCFAAAWKLHELSDDRRQGTPVGGRRATPWALLFWLSLGLAILAKGPVALGVLLAAGLAHAALTRTAAFLEPLRAAWWGPLLCTAVVAPWCWAVQEATGGRFLDQALGHHVYNRTVMPLENHRGFPGYYLFALLVFMTPFSWALPWAAWELRGHVRTDRRLVCVLAWRVGPLLMFEIVRTKLVHYTLPTYPAVALLLAAAAVGRLPGRAGVGLARFDPRLGPVGLVLCPILAAVGIAMAVLYTPAPLRLPAGLTVGTAALGLGLASQLLRLKQHRAGFVAATATVAVSLLVVYSQLLPAFSRGRLILAVADRLKARPPNTPVALFQYRDPSLVLVLGGPIPIIDPINEGPEFPETVALAGRLGRFVCPMLPPQLKSMSQDARLSLEVVETVTGWEPNRRHWREVHLVAVSPAPVRVAAAKR